ncbi:hypothetical protein SPV_2509 [Streptococcus pneumoniae]|nr:hypothetical protein SPV_2509 [Streptococcus pneumoniae]
MVLILIKFLKYCHFEYKGV